VQQDLKGATMPRATVTSKGQITIPAKVRKKLGLSAGSVVDFEPYNNSFILSSRKADLLDELDELEGFFDYSGPTYTVDDMKAAVLQKAMERFDKSSAGSKGENDGNDEKSGRA
jgi:AbrB family looped-hinge helix DNA binding protein